MCFTNFRTSGDANLGNIVHLILIQVDSLLGDDLFFLEVENGEPEAVLHDFLLVCLITYNHLTLNQKHGRKALPIFTELHSFNVDAPFFQSIKPHLGVTALMIKVMVVRIGPSMRSHTLIVPVVFEVDVGLIIHLLLSGVTEEHDGAFGRQNTHLLLLVEIFLIHQYFPEAFRSQVVVMKLITFHLIYLLVDVVFRVLHVGLDVLDYFLGGEDLSIAQGQRLYCQMGIFDYSNLTIIPYHYVFFASHDIAISFANDYLLISLLLLLVDSFHCVNKTIR